MAEIDECVECIFRIDMEGLSDGTTVVFNGRCTGEKIIRCKDCRHYKTITLHNVTQGFCNRLGLMTMEIDDFCSRAERKEECL